MTGNAIATVAIDRSEIEVNAGSGEPVSRTETARVTFSNAPAIVNLRAERSATAIEFVDLRTVNATDTDLDLRFAAASELGAGTFADTVTVTACYDPDCEHHLEGSPLTIDTTFRVHDVADPGVTPLEVESRAALAHDIVDAEFSAALNSIVMVASYPANALYVYDVPTGTERSQSLNKVPTSVSIAPDGLTAAVGHDALISVVDLATVGPGASAPIPLTVSADISDLVTDGAGNVHALPRTDQSVNVHSVNIANNTEELGTLLYAGARGRLHPSGTVIYTADNGLSPSDILKHDIATGIAIQLYDLPYHGDYAICGNLWFNEGGSTIYTKCGNP